MRLLKIGVYYPNYLEQFYARRPGLAAQPYAAQHAPLIGDFFGSSGFWHGEYLDVMEDAHELTVTDGNFFGHGEVPPATHGCCLVDARWRVEAETALDGDGGREVESEARQAAGGRA